jgi:hypothetical protein
MKVYTVRFEAVTDDGCATLGDLYVYDNITDAQKKYNELLNEEKQYAEDRSLKTEELTDSFSSWREGEWSTEHTILSIYEDTILLPFTVEKTWHDEEQNFGLIYHTSLN